MKREYLKENVYEAFKSRMELIFREFDNIYLFPEGKTAGCY